jgi:hypothetical protein
MKATLRLAILVLSVCGVGSDLIAKPASRKSRPLRIVIDASHDGGAWWFRQAPPPFDPKSRIRVSRWLII